MVAFNIESRVWHSWEIDSFRGLRVLFVADERATHMRHWAAFLAKRGATVGYVAFGPIAGLPVQRRYRIDPWFSWNYLKFVVNAPRLASVVRSFRPDIVHAYYLTNYGLLAALLGHPGFVVTVAGSDVFVEPRRSPLLRWVVRFVWRRAALVHSVARHMTQELIRQGVCASKIVTAHEGVDLAAFGGATRTTARREPVVVCTRNFRPVYDVGTLVRAVPQVVRRDKSVRFVLVGDGPEREKLASVVDGQRLRRWVRFTGHVSWQVLGEILRSAAVYVSPSMSDGTSISLLRAMACGAFPVVTDIPANREWIRHGQNGLLFPVGDSHALAEEVVIALHDADMRRRAARVNQRIVERACSDEAMLSRIAEAYRRVLDGNVR